MRANSAGLDILLVDDDDDDHVIVRDLLGEIGSPSLRLSWAPTYDAGMTALASTAPDIALIDYSLGAKDGIQFIREARASGVDIPLIILTGHAERDIDLEAMEAGADDFLEKSTIEAVTLERAIRYAVEQRRLRRELDRTRSEQIELKDRFLSHVSHELRTPLAALHQFLSILLDGLAGDVTDEQREILAGALRNADHLKVMVADLLEASRIRDARFTVSPRPTRLGPIVEETVASLAPAAGMRAIRVEARVDDRFEVDADPDRIRQVLVNLLDNAIKFTTDGGEIEVAARLDPTDAGRVRVEVADTGCGIPETDLDRVFEWNYQVEDGNDRPRRGLGLGLGICEEIVRRHGGRIVLRSTVGEGTRVSFDLPVAAGAAPAARVPAAGRSSAPRSGIVAP